LRINIEEWIQKWLQLTAGHLWSLGLLRQRHIDASPHTNYLPEF
jgi:hypothetical protein